MTLDHSAATTHLVMDVGGGHVTAAEVALDPEHHSARVDTARHDSGQVDSARHDSPRPDSGARILRRHEVDLDSSGSRTAILDALATAARPFVTRDAPWTIAMPGPFDDVLGIGSFAGIGKFGAIAGVDLRAALAGPFDTQPTRISFLNDAVAYGIGEWASGQDGPRPDRLVCLTLGTGVGSAFLRDGVAVLAGDTVPTDGAAYTIEYEGAPLEETVSTRAIRRAYTDRTGNPGGSSDGDRSGDGPTVAEIAHRAQVGDPDARAVFQEAMTHLGRAVGPWIDRFGATTLVVGGAMSQSWSLLEPGLSAGLSDARRRTGARPLTDLRPSRLLADAPLLGAAEWARRTEAP